MYIGAVELNSNSIGMNEWIDLDDDIGTLLLWLLDNMIVVFVGFSVGVVGVSRVISDWFMELGVLYIRNFKYIFLKFHFCEVKFGEIVLFIRTMS